MIIKLIGELFLLAFALCSIGLMHRRSGAADADDDGFDADAGAAAVVPVRRALPDLESADVAGDAHPDQPGDVRRAHDPLHGVRLRRRPAAALEQLNPPIEWFGWTVPMVVQLGIVVVLGVAMLVVATAEFNRVE